MVWFLEDLSCGKEGGALMIRKRACILVLVMLAVFCVQGCEYFEKSENGDVLSYDICDETMLPEELSVLIDRKKEKAFNLVYSNSTYTYIVVGAGMMERDDVIMEVDEMYKDDNAVYVRALPRQSATPTDGVIGDGVSFPYIAIRIQREELPVVFK
jgi:hypothetical protein